MKSRFAPIAAALARRLLPLQQFALARDRQAGERGAQIAGHEWFGDGTREGLNRANTKWVLRPDMLRLNEKQMLLASSLALAPAIANAAPPGTPAPKVAITMPKPDELGIGSNGWQYRQACLVALVNTPYPQQDVTWQQFTPTGPRAFLPLPDQQGSVVWYDDLVKVKQLAALNSTQLTQQLRKAFAAQLGEVEVVSSSWFPLARMDANRYYAGRVVLAGDAAHTINPLAGQGVNLGFADAKLLTELIINAQRHNADIGSEALLRSYQRKRKPANLLMMSAMDGFYQDLKQFIVLHYCLSNRTDTPFWQAAPDTARHCQGLWPTKPIPIKICVSAASKRRNWCKTFGNTVWGKCLSSSCPSCRLPHRK